MMKLNDEVSVLKWDGYYGPYYKSASSDLPLRNEYTFFVHKNSLFAHNQFSSLFFSMKMTQSEKIVLVSCFIDFDNMQV